MAVFVGSVLLYGWPGHDWLTFALIRVAHIGFDRLADYGLEQDRGFKSTHMG